MTPKRLSELKTTIPAWLAIIIAIISFLYSIGAFSKFDLETKINGFVVTTDEELDLGYIIPITFLNISNKDGVIQDIYINLTYKNWNEEFKPTNEINIEKFFGFRSLKSNVFLGPFHIFNIGKKDVQQKTFLFYPVSKNKRNLESGNYSISLYIKTLNKDQFQKVDSFEFNVFDNAILALKTGKKSVYFMGGSDAYTLEKD